jgi:hypothetical protein
MKPVQEVAELAKVGALLSEFAAKTTLVGIGLWDGARCPRFEEIEQEPQAARAFGARLALLVLD